MTTKFPETRPAFSCDGMNEQDQAHAVADATKESNPYYHISVMSYQGDLADKLLDLCESHDMSPLFHPADLDVCGSDDLDHRITDRVGAIADRIDAPWLTIDLAMWVRGGEALTETLIPMPLVESQWTTSANVSVVSKNDWADDWRSRMPHTRSVSEIRTLCR